MSKEEKQRKEYRILFIVDALFILPLFIILAIIDSVQNHVVYSWSFILAFFFALIYLLGIIPFNSYQNKIDKNLSYYYVGIFFLLIFFLGTYGFNREYSLGSQITIGLIVGALSGMSCVSLYFWKIKKKI